MAITTEPSLPSGLPSAADRAVVSGAAASETSVTTSAVVASAAAAAVIVVANDNNHPHDGHNVDDCLHDGHNDMIVDDGLTLYRSPLAVLPVDYGDRH
jgi:hypothetical protein